MLANKLNVLLAERQLSIKEVVEDTGLSRNSISNISNNVGANISTDTIDILCNYLGITPSDFFEYAPLRINVESLTNKKEPQIIVKTLQHRKEFSYFYNIVFKDSDFDEEQAVRNKEHDLYLDIYTDFSGDDFLEIYQNLPAGFQTDITKKFITTIEELLNSDFSKNIYARQNTMDSKIENLPELLKLINKDKLTLSIKLPWIDITKVLIIKNNIYKIK
ncbi:helix-turn-helix domain-containing protein [Companilactobacillus paralimentarius]|uniref:helix-turn-helix domain-containing protein n=1 Tax=Companilactobacillus paralimentarius TaxID=83526 RepID=UPI0037DFF6E1